MFLLFLGTGGRSKRELFEARAARASTTLTPALPSTTHGARMTYGSSLSPLRPVCMLCEARGPLIVYAVCIVAGRSVLRAATW